MAELENMTEAAASAYELVIERRDRAHLSAASPCPRTILIHLNVEVPADDPRSGDEIADKVLAALEVGLEGAPGDLASDSEGVHFENMVVANALTEEV